MKTQAKEIAKLKNLLFRTALLMDGYNLADIDYECKDLLAEIDKVALGMLPLREVEAKPAGPKLYIVS